MTSTVASYVAAAIATTTYDVGGGRESVGAGLHRDVVEGLVGLALGLGVGRDPVRAADLELAEQVAVLDEHVALILRLGGVLLELGAGVCDVQVPHGQLPDSV